MLPLGLLQFSWTRGDFGLLACFKLLPSLRVERKNADGWIRGRESARGRPGRTPSGKNHVGSWIGKKMESLYADHHRCMRKIEGYSGGKCRPGSKFLGDGTLALLARSLELRGRMRRLAATCTAANTHTRRGVQVMILHVERPLLRQAGGAARRSSAWRPKVGGAIRRW